MLSKLRQVSGVLSKGAAVRQFRSTALKAAASESPAMTKVYGGLKDEDRIFTNLYGVSTAADATRHLNFPQLLHFSLQPHTTRRFPQHSRRALTLCTT